MARPRISAGSSAYNSAFFSLRATIDNIVSQVITQFYQVVLNRALIVAQEQNVNLLQQQVKDQQQGIFWRVSIFGPIIGYMTQLNLVILLA